MEARQREKGSRYYGNLGILLSLCKGGTFNEDYCIFPASYYLIFKCTLRFECCIKQYYPDCLPIVVFRTDIIH